MRPDEIQKSNIDDAITTLNRINGDGKQDYADYEEMFDAISIITDGVDFPAASPWRRVEDGLPPDNRFVLVCNDDHRYGVAQYVGDDGLTPWQIAYCLYDVDLWDDEEQGPVRYWMPIEPPKEE